MELLEMPVSIIMKQKPTYPLKPDTRFPEVQLKEPSQKSSKVVPILPKTSKADPKINAQYRHL